MTKVLIELSENARNTQSQILQPLAVINNGDIAKRLNIDGATFSRFVNEKKTNGLTNIEMFSEMLNMLGLKVVPADHVFCSEEVVEATRILLKNAFNSPDYMKLLFK